MSYATSSGMKSGRLVTTKASAAETSSTTHASTAVQPGESSVIVTVAVTAASGTTPTLTVVVEGSVDGTTWFTLGIVGASGFSVGVGTAPTNLTAAATSYGAFPATPFVRTRSVVGGTTPSFTYSVNVQVV